jgi:oxygen-dependent protoporphyrinogen oxidase
MPLADRLALVRAGARLRLSVARYDRVTAPRAGESPAARRARAVGHLADRSFAEFIGALPPAADAVFRPTLARSSAEPEQLAAGQGVGYFALVWTPGGGLSNNIIGGSSRLVEQIATELGDRITMRASVETVTAVDGGVELRATIDGEPRRIAARHAVVATPAYEAARILPDVPRETAAALSGIRYGPYVVMALLTSETEPMPWDHLYALATPDRPFNMLFNTANVLRGRGPRMPGGSLMLYRGAEGARRLMEMTDAEIERTFLDGLYALYPAARGIVGETAILRLPHALPYPHPGRHLLQAGLERRLDPIHLAGDYLGGWYTETAISSGQEAARAIRRALAATGSGARPQAAA